MAKRLWLVLALGLALIGARPALADVWDVATHDDNSATSTENDLVHGSDQIHDLADTVPGTTADQDWFTVGEASNSSYQVVVDGTTGDIGGVTINRTDASGTNVIQTGVAVGVGYSQSLSWDHAGAGVAEAIEVTSSLCGTATQTCTTDDQYRIRFYDTTCAVARFNNSATQVTVLVLQNTTSNPVNGNFYLWDATGAQVNVGGSAFTIAGNGASVTNTSILAPGVSGSVTVTTDGGYGSIAGKAVAVEPATGFTFDTGLSCRPH
jgi:hypothetical protein